jgi:F-type H+-transporting ATPase subunit gamma
MAKGMQDIKRRIKSTQNTRQITKAMEMVAASNLRKAQLNAEAARPYADKIKEMVASIASSSANVKHPMLTVREVKKTGYFVITSDRGLAGGFNANLLRKVHQTIRERHRSQDEYTVFVIGRKGLDFFKARNIPVIQDVTGLPDAPQYSDIAKIAKMAVTHFAEGHYDELYLYYNEFVSAISQVPVEKKLLPLTDIGNAAEKTSAAYEYEPSAEEVLNVLLPRYAETLIYSAVLESKASEFGARMTAMGNATKNADEMIEQYTLAYNRARQAAITQEINEIVGGANALS